MLTSKSQSPWPLEFAMRLISVIERMCLYTSQVPARTVTIVTDVEQARGEAHRAHPHRFGPTLNANMIWVCQACQGTAGHASGQLLLENELDEHRLVVLRGMVTPEILNAFLLARPLDPAGCCEFLLFGHSHVAHVEEPLAPAA